MLLTPRYDAPPAIAIEVRDPGPHPVVQQRRRLEALLTELSDEEWAAPTRCDGWTVQDVITHLHSTNGFWALSVAQGLAGEPTRFLGSFDPVATPAQLVDTARGTPPAETLATFCSSNADLRTAFEGLDEAGWETMGEAPPGHVPLRLVADHALWDCWVHERDILLPLGRPTVEDPDEVLTCLRYAAALGRAFEANQGRDTGSGAAALRVTDPEACIVVEAADGQVRVSDGPVPVGAHVIDFGAVPLLEMLSIRDAGGPVPDTLGWLTSGLELVFDHPDGA